MKVLITGVCGFIGSHLAEKFKNSGDIVIGLDRCASPFVTPQYIIDIAKDDLEPILKKESPDLVIHCAGLADVQYSVNNPDDDFVANTHAVHKMLFYMKKCNLVNCRFVFLSSAAVYGQPEKLPIDENCELKPLSPYALHKKMAEDICMFFADNYQFDIRILRVFSAYGPGLRKQLFWDMYRTIKKNGCLDLWGTGKESRDYIFIDDLVHAIYLIAVDTKTNYMVWNVANGEEITIEKVARTFLEVENDMRYELKFRNAARGGEALNWCADVSRLKGLGYKKSTDMREGIKKYVEWVKYIENIGLSR